MRRSITLLELVRYKSADGAASGASYDIKRIAALLTSHDINEDGELSFQEYCIVEEETGGAGLWENPVVVSAMRTLAPEKRARYEQVWAGWVPPCFVN